MRKPRVRMAVTAALAVCSWLVAAPHPVTAQNIFDPAAQVGDGVVTNYEVEQRARLLAALGRPGVTRELALDEMVDDRLKLAAAAQAGIVPDAIAVDQGVDEFAGRADLSGPELVEAFQDAGIAPETLRLFVRATVAWNQLVRERFAARARPSDAEVDRALDLGTGQGSARVLASEIVLPLGQGVDAISRERAEAIAEIDSTEDFEAAARRFSVAPSRADGGRLDWLPLSELPPQIAPLFLSLRPGEVSPPVPLGNSLAIFQLRALQDVRPPRAANVTLDFIRMPYPPGADLAAAQAELRAQADTCDDIYGVFFDRPDGLIQRQSAARSALPSTIAAVLDGLDPNEIAAFGPAVPGGAASLVMLCNREETRQIDLTRDQVAQQLFQQRLTSYAEAYLSELRADAFIEVN